MMQGKRYLLLVCSLLLVAGCPDWFTSSLEESPDTVESGQATLTEGDFPDVSPCRDRDTLPEDTAFLDVITNATQVIHIHDEYTGDDNLSAICGLSGIDNTLEVSEKGWDPSEGADLYICYKYGEALSEYLSSDLDNPGICRSNFGFETGNTFDGFPRAGTYRLDVCIESGANSYRVRLRISVSGNDVNQTLTQAEVEDQESLEFFDVEGIEVTTTEVAKVLFTENPEGFTFTVRSGEGVNTHMEVEVRVICVKKQESACPQPDVACSTT